MTADERSKFDAKQAALARAMAKPKVPVMNSKAHRNMVMDVDMDGAREEEELVVDEATLMRAKDA